MAEPHSQRQLSSPSPHFLCQEVSAASHLDLKPPSTWLTFPTSVYLMQRAPVFAHHLQQAAYWTLGQPHPRDSLDKTQLP